MAVGRQVEVPNITINAQILTTCTQDYHGTSQDRAEQQGWQTETEKGVVGQAEHPEADNNTFPARQPTTTKVAVLRQVDVPAITIRVLKLTLYTQADTVGRVIL